MDKELHSIFREDQKERENHPQYGTPEYWELRSRDSHRRMRVDKIVENRGLITPEDYYHAAMIFQHGESLEDIWKAYTLATRSAELGYRPARWLAAASYDRWLMYKGEPQKYGTQFVPDGKRYRLWEIDPATTDEQRAEWDVPPLQQQEARAEELTRTEPIPPMEEAPPWLKKAIMRWEHDKV